MPSVRLKDNEPFDIALRRFKRSCEKAGVLSEVRRREFYEKPTTMRKRKAAAAVKLFVYPSIYEGFGLPPLEALASGTPVVCSNASSLPEVVGNAGLLVPPHDTQALTAALRRVLSDSELITKLQYLGALQAASFTWEQAARQTVKVYEKMG